MASEQQRVAALGSARFKLKNRLTPKNFVSRAEENEFGRDYGGEIALCNRLYEQQIGIAKKGKRTKKELVRVAKEIYKPWGHYFNIAAYLHAIKEERPLVLAGLAHGLSQSYREQFLKEVPNGERENVERLMLLYDSLRHTEGTDINLRMAYGSMDHLRATVIRGVDMLHTLHELRKKRDWRDYEEIAQHYIPLFSYALLHQRLGDDLYDRLMEVTLDAKEYRNYDEVKSSAQNYAATSMDRLRPFIEDLQKELEQRGFKRDRHYEISVRPKLGTSVFRKMRQKGYSFYNIPDLFGFRIIIKKGKLSENKAYRKCIRALDVIKQVIQKDEHPTVLGRDIEGNEIENLIVKPRPSGYKAIHVPVEYWREELEVPLRFEIQVLGDHHHEFNEYGGASVVSYKLKDLPPELKEFLGKIRAASTWADREKLYDEMHPYAAPVQEHPAPKKTIPTIPLQPLEPAQKPPVPWRLVAGGRKGRKKKKP